MGVCLGTGLVAGPVAGALVSANFNAASVGKNLAEENYLQAGMNGAFCVFDLCTAGVASGACDAVKETAVTTTKQTSRTAVTKTTSEVTKQVMGAGAQQVTQQTASATVVSVSNEFMMETTKKVTQESVKEAAVGTTKTIMKTASQNFTNFASSEVLSLSAQTAEQLARVQIQVTKEAAVFTAKQTTMEITETVSKSTASCLVEAVANGGKVVGKCQTAYTVGKHGKNLLRTEGESRNKAPSSLLTA